MDEIDWGKFRERIPVGTRIRYDMETDLPLHVEGVLIEPEERWDEYTAHIIHYPSGRTSPIAYNYPAHLMEYLIDGTWKTLAEIMA